MKRLNPRYKLVIHRPAQLVGQERTVLGDYLFFQCLEARFHQVRRRVGIKVVNGELVKFSTHEAPFDSSGLSLWKKTFFGLDAQNPQVRLIRRHRNRNIQCLAGSPRQKFLGRVAPVQSVGRLKNGLGKNLSARQQQGGGDDQSANVTNHDAKVIPLRRFRKARSLRRGFVLVEAMMSLSMLTVLGLVLLQLSLNILNPRQWILQQTVTDAYMTYERAYAERIPFENLLASDSPWPAYPTTTATAVEVGRLPGGIPIAGTVTRTRLPDADNYPGDGGTGTVTSNPAAMKVWKAQSVLTYQIGARNYAKSRTVLRSQ